MFCIDLASGEPLEHQIHRELRRVIAAGEVVAGDRLPSARQLAADLGVHWNTVARAYRRLGEEGLATVGRGRPVVVRKSEAGGRRAAKRLPAYLRELVTEARLAGLTRAELESAIASEMDRWQWRMGQ